MRDRMRAASTISPKPPSARTRAQVGTASRSVLELGNPVTGRVVLPAPGVAVAATAATATGVAVPELGVAVDETGVADEGTGVPAGVALGPTGVGVADGAKVK